MKLKISSWAIFLLLAFDGASYAETLDVDVFKARRAELM
jgi:hypothetical protein